MIIVSTAAYCGSDWVVYVIYESHYAKQWVATPPLPYHCSLYFFPVANPLLQLVYVLFWGAAVIVTLIYVYKHGEEFVNQPKLSKCD